MGQWTSNPVPKSSSADADAVAAQLAQRFACAFIVVGTISVSVISSSSRFASKPESFSESRTVFAEIATDELRGRQVDGKA